MYCTVNFYSILLYTLSKILKRNKIQCPDIGMCFGELPSVNDTLFSWPKRSHWFIEPPLFRAGFAIPEGAPLSGDHCIVKCEVDAWRKSISNNETNLAVQ